MLLEIINKEPLKKSLSIDEIPATIRTDMQKIIAEKCNLDISKSTLNLNKNDCGQIVLTFKKVYDKIQTLNFSLNEVKSLVINNIMSNLFDVWRRCEYSLSFFAAIKQTFSAAIITAVLSRYINNSNIDDILDFFFEKKDKIFSKNRPIKTIALYYYSMFNNGIARFITLIVPILLDMGYKIVVITDDIDEERDYPLPQSENLKRIVIKTPYDNFLGRLEELTNYVNEYKIDLFCSHAYYGKFQPLYQILFFKLLNVPVVMEMHNIFTVIVPFNRKLDKIYRLADAIINLSRTDKTFWSNQGCNCYYIPNPIYKEIVENRTKRDPKVNRKTILWIGQFNNQKQPLEIVPVMKEVVKYIPDAKINVVANPTDKILFEKVQSDIKSNSLEKNVNLCGFHLNVAPFFESADVMLMTSAVEGFPYIVIENKLYELPLVCYELPYLEFFRNGKGYISVRQQDRHAAAMAIVKILTDDDLREKMSIEARESIQPFIDYDIAGAWKKVFDDVEANIRHDEKNFEMEQIELLMMQSLSNQNMQIRYLNNVVNNLKQHK